MYKQLLSLLTFFICFTSFSQTVSNNYADSFVFKSKTGKTEIVYKNSSDTIPGFLFNNGDGKLIFKRAVQKINDSVFIFGADTLTIHPMIPQAVQDLTAVQNSFQQVLNFGNSINKDNTIQLDKYRLSINANKGSYSSSFSTIGIMSNTASGQMAVASSLGLKNIRAGEILTTGDVTRHQRFSDAGYTVQISIGYNPFAEHNRTFPTAAQLPAFRQSFQNFLTTNVKGYKVSFFALENEENNATYAANGIVNTQDYINELTAAIQIAHDNNYLITNGGLTGPQLKRWTWKWLTNNGRIGEASEFAAREFSQTDIPNLDKWETIDKYKDGAAVINALITAYASLGLDFVNFHYYGPGKDSTSDAAGAAASLRSINVALQSVTGKKIITNELGQYNHDTDLPAIEISAMTEVGAPYIFWYNGESPDAGTGNNAVAISNVPDNSLRPNGEALKQWLNSYTGTVLSNSDYRELLSINSDSFNVKDENYLSFKTKDSLYSASFEINRNQKYQNPFIVQQVNYVTPALDQFYNSLLQVGTSGIGMSANEYDNYGNYNDAELSLNSFGNTALYGSKSVDISTDNGNISLFNSSGAISLNSGSNQYEINALAYKFPSEHDLGVLANDGSGNLVWKPFSQLQGNVDLSAYALKTDLTPYALKTDLTSKVDKTTTISVNGANPQSLNGNINLVVSSGNATTTAPANFLLQNDGTKIDSTSLYWSRTNGRLGIKNTTPQYNLDLTGSLNVGGYGTNGVQYARFATNTGYGANLIYGLEMNSTADSYHWMTGVDNSGAYRILYKESQSLGNYTFDRFGNVHGQFFSAEGLSATYSPLFRVDNTSGTESGIFRPSGGGISMDAMRTETERHTPSLITEFVPVKFMPGTTTMAPINIPVGTLKTTPVNGDLENDGSFIYYTNSTGFRAPIIMSNRFTDTLFADKVLKTDTIIATAGSNGILVYTGAQSAASDLMRWKATNSTTDWVLNNSSLMSGASLSLARDLTVSGNGNISFITGSTNSVQASTNSQRSGFLFKTNAGTTKGYLSFVNNGVPGTTGTASKMALEGISTDVAISTDAGNSYAINVSAANNSTSINGLLYLKSYTVATLPTATVGALAYVTDASNPQWNQTITGGGTTTQLVFYNGTAWTAH